MLKLEDGGFAFFALSASIPPGMVAFGRIAFDF